jgi:hypothetical protein
MDRSAVRDRLASFAILAMRRSLVALLATALATALSTAACGDLKVADDDAPAGPANGSDGGAKLPDGASADPTYGAGPHGSLPSGYCCNADTDCRYRRCVDTGSAGGKMCLDECFSQPFCTRPDLTFTCVTPDAGGRGLCQPPSSATACIPANTFKRGADPIGACCNAGDPAAADGTTASHCEGYQCASVGTGPYVCTHRCTFSQDCPSGFECLMFGTSKACVPTTDGYTCN